MSESIDSKQGLLDYERSLDCVHCGLCLEHCPTYVRTGRESAGPRGRIYMMRALMEDRIQPTPDLVADLDLCLVCRACETACPSGVRYGDMIAFARSETRQRGLIRRALMGLLPRPRLLRSAVTLMRLYQRTPLRALRHLLPARLRALEANMPPVPSGRERRPLPQEIPARTPAIGRVAVLEGCVMPLLFPEVNRATVTLLTAAGFNVVVPKAQTCCGALHEHDGDRETARALARRNVAAFEGARVDHVVLNSAGCGAALAGYAHLLPDEGDRGLGDRVVDLTRILLDHGSALTFAPFTGRVTYDAPCHLHHAQGETTAPLDLLRRVPDLDFVPLENAEECCGAAGIYNLDQPAMSTEILDDKLDALERTGATTLLTGNPGCLLQWRQGVARRKLDVAVLHPATFLVRLLPAT